MPARPCGRYDPRSTPRRRNGAASAPSAVDGTSRSATASRLAECADRLSDGLDTIAFRAGPIRDRLRALASEVKNERRSLAEAQGELVKAVRGTTEGVGEAGGGPRQSERQDQAGGEQREPAGRKPPTSNAAVKVEPTTETVADALPESLTCQGSPRRSCPPFCQPQGRSGPARSRLVASGEDCGPRCRDHATGVHQ